MQRGAEGNVRYLSRSFEIEIVGCSPGRPAGRFKEPVRAITPGLVAVFKNGDTVVAAGRIE